VIFVDTNVIMYAVGAEHPLKSRARDFFEEALANGIPLATSAEVLQELLHAYLAVERMEALDAALALVQGRIPTVWSVESDDILLARTLAGSHAALSARDLVHLACCTRREVTQVKTFDRGLAAAMSG
jgi:predicted nucleic acid-binding protein